MRPQLAEAAELSLHPPLSVALPNTQLLSATSLRSQAFPLACRPRQAEPPRGGNGEGRLFRRRSPSGAVRCGRPFAPLSGHAQLGGPFVPGHPRERPRAPHDPRGTCLRYAPVSRGQKKKSFHSVDRTGRGRDPGADSTRCRRCFSSSGNWVRQPPARPTRPDAKALGICGPEQNGP